MWADDRLWFPHLLSGEFFRGRFLFAGDTLLGYEIIVENEKPGEEHLTPSPG
jgi:hypothetical protein